MPAILWAFRKELRGGLGLDKSLHVREPRSVAFPQQRRAQLGCAGEIQLVIELQNLVGGGSRHF